VIFFIHKNTRINNHFTKRNTHIRFLNIISCYSAKYQHKVRSNNMQAREKLVYLFAFTRRLKLVKRAKEKKY